jgi:hypothetical protein
LGRHVHRFSLLTGDYLQPGKVGKHGGQFLQAQPLFDGFSKRAHQSHVAEECGTDNLAIAACQAAIIAILSHLEEAGAGV